MRVNRLSSDYFVLPAKAFFGDFQILLNLRSAVEYLSSEDSDTYTMCLPKFTFLRLLEMYPEAKEHFTMQAKARRIEFKRLRKQYIKEFDIRSDEEEERIQKYPETYGKNF